MSNLNYYQLKCVLINVFYQNILKEKYTAHQSANKCLKEFQDDIQKDNLHQLIIYATILAKVADYNEDSLKQFNNEIILINQLSKTIDFSQVLNEDEKISLEQDIALIQDSFL